MLTKKALGGIGVGLLALGGFAGMTLSKYLPVNKTTKPEVMQSVVTPTASPSATPTVVLTPSPVRYYYHVPVVTKSLVK